MPNRTVFFISDGTGITAETFGNSILAQFPGKPRKVRRPFIDTVEKAESVGEANAVKCLPRRQIDQRKNDAPIGRGGHANFHVDAANAPPDENFAARETDVAHRAVRARVAGAHACRGVRRCHGHFPVAAPDLLRYGQNGGRMASKSLKASVKEG